MAVVSHPALSPEWSFPSPLSPFDAPSFSSHVELADLTPVGAVHQLQITNKRRAHEAEWDDGGADRVDMRAKKPKVSSSHTVNPQQLHGNHSGPQALPDAQVSSNVPPPQIEQVISILVDAFASPTPIPSSTKLTATPSSQTGSDITVSILANVSTPSPPSISRIAPTSPLSESPNRVPFVRKAIGGSCAGRTEASLTRWVLCRNHFLSVRSLDPTTQPAEWVHTLHEMGWEQLHPFYQAQAAERDAQTFGTLSAFSRWIEDEFDYDGTEDCDGEWSDEEEDDGEMQEQRGVWDSGVVLQLPCKSSS